MNLKLILKAQGFIFLIEAGLMLLPLLVAFIYREGDWVYFAASIAGLLILGGILFLIKPSGKGIHAKDGFIIAAFAWIFMSMAAAVPFTISGAIPDYLNACFETVSGFTTSGVTALTDIESLSQSMLFWRSFTHWIGGMGVLVFMLAIMPLAGGTSMHIIRAESPGPVTEKITPKISQTAKWLYLIYFVFTVAEILALSIFGLSFIHACMITFGTVATGGFSYLSTSLVTMTVAQQNVVMVFMFLCGINFALFFMIATGRALKAILNEELIWYVGIFISSVCFVCAGNCLDGVFETFGETLQKSAFMVTSVMTTTGFSVCDVNVWPVFSKYIIMAIMIIGACAGSTAGGLKVSRFAVMIKSAVRYLRELIHPRSVNVVRFNGKPMGSDAVRGILEYVGLMIIVFFASLLVVAADPEIGSLDAAFSAVNTTLNNNGIAFGAASGSFSVFAWYSKIVFIVDMLIGRLEIFPIMILLATFTSPVVHRLGKIGKRNRA